MRNILVIDDSDDIRMVVVKTLANFGYATREAKDGLQGIQMALDEQPDLIICDVAMPGMDGYRTLAAIRELPVIASIPFIFMTARVGRDDLRRAMASGADDYLTKPFQPEELIEAVMSRLERHEEMLHDAAKRAEKLHTEVLHLVTEEMKVPLNGILGTAASLMRDHATLPPEKIFSRAHDISDSVLRLNQLTSKLK
ncbi:MAG TPA: response regulator [Verrucomicrobiae bacterium]|nr:response regulator [Verrucomicrobiae bacterium]